MGESRWRFLGLVQIFGSDDKTEMGEKKTPQKHHGESTLGTTYTFFFVAVDHVVFFTGFLPQKQITRLDVEQIKKGKGTINLIPKNMLTLRECNKTQLISEFSTRTARKMEDILSKVFAAGFDWSREWKIKFLARKYGDVHSFILLTEEILHQLIGSLSHFCGVSYIPGDCLGFQPSTVFPR